MARAESLALFMFQKPRTAKRLYFDVIPKAVDEYIAFLDAYHATETSEAQRLENPVWHIHGGKVPDERYPVSFALLLNLVSASNAHNRDVLWGFIRAYAPRRVAGEQSGPGPAGGLCAALLRGFREAGEAISRAPTTRNAPRWKIWPAQLEKLGDERDGADGAECRLRSRQGAWLRAAARLVRGALRSAVRPDRRARASAPSPPCSAARETAA